MKINFTKNEYHLLVEMLTIADWVMHASCVDNEVTHKKHRELRDKIFSFYKEFDAENLIDTGLEKDVYYETDTLLDNVHDSYIAPYKDGMLLDELSYRLAQRDVFCEVGPEAYGEMEKMERFSKILNAQESYVNEFAKHGLENVIIKLSTEK